jgi:hypothetical protein
LATMRGAYGTGRGGGVGIVFASASMLPQIIPAFGQRPLAGKRERSADHKEHGAL